MTNPLEDLLGHAAAAERTNDVHRAMEQMRDDARRVSRTFEEIQAETYDGEDGTQGVRCTVDGTGRVTAIRITAKGMQSLDHEALGRAVVEAYQDAQLNLNNGLQEALQSRLGLSMDENPEATTDLNEMFLKIAREKGSR